VNIGAFFTGSIGLGYGIPVGVLHADINSGIDQRLLRPSGIGWTPRTVSHTQNNHVFRDYFVADYVGANGNQLPHLRSRNRPATVWEVFEAIASGEQSIDHEPRRPWIGINNEVVSAPDAA
jgi:hypothetical protein